MTDLVPALLKSKTRGAIDVSSFYATDGLSFDEPMTIDLYQVRYVDHEVLLFLIGVLEERRIRQLPTKIRLPKATTSIDFLRAWNFDTAVGELLTTRFEDVLEPESRERYLALGPLPSKYNRVRITPDGARETMLSMSFFSTTLLQVSSSYLSEGDMVERVATLERDKWLNAHLVGVLDRYLTQRNYGDRVATNVVYEAVRNAAMHPKATKSFATSQLLRELLGYDKDNKPIWGNPSCLEVGIWDNGLSVLSTLRARLVDTGHVTAPSYGMAVEEFELVVRDGGGPARTDIVWTNKPYAHTTEVALIASAFMLGVTSLPDRPSEASIEQEGVSLRDLVRGQPGAGLYVLRTTVVDDFGGSIHYNSGRYRMSISAGERPGHYKFTFETTPEDGLTVAGNNLLVRLPLADRNPDE